MLIDAAQGSGLDVAPSSCGYPGCGSCKLALMSPDEIDLMGEALHETLELRELLRRLVED